MLEYDLYKGENMINLISKIYIKKEDSISTVRYKYGTICSIMGIILNTIICVFKIIIGLIFASISLVADGINNLSDAASSIVTLIGFKMARKKADSAHPFGHGRIEYISGFVVAICILIMGLDLLKTSFTKFISTGHADLRFNYLLILSLILSIVIKLYMYIYNRNIGKKINSEALKATAKDSISDVFASLCVLISLLFSKWFDFNFDAIGGMLVSLFIIYTGFNTSLETLSPILGKKTDSNLINKIKAIALSHNDILGLHDIVVHDYGPNNLIATLHAEVDENHKLSYIHGVIDEIEKEIKDKLGIQTTIHIDPIDMDNAYLQDIISIVNVKVKEEIDKNASIHDLRIIDNHIVIFDILLPFENKISDTEILEKLNLIVKKLNENFVIKVEIDRE